MLPLIAYYCAPAIDKNTAMQLTVLDVGQGLAVVLETADLVMVYDAGPAYGDRFNAGAGIIALYLCSKGHSKIDQLIISHEDMDHAGGLQGLMQSIAVGELIPGPGLKLPAEQAEDVGYMPAAIKVCAVVRNGAGPSSCRKVPLRQYIFICRHRANSPLITSVPKAITIPVCCR